MSGNEFGKWTYSGNAGSRARRPQGVPPGVPTRSIVEVPAGADIAQGAAVVVVESGDGVSVAVPASTIAQAFDELVESELGPGGIVSAVKESPGDPVAEFPRRAKPLDAEFVHGYMKKHLTRSPDQSADPAGNFAAEQIEMLRPKFDRMSKDEAQVFADFVSKLMGPGLEEYGNLNLDTDRRTIGAFLSEGKDELRDAVFYLIVVLMKLERLPEPEAGQP